MKRSLKIEKKTKKASCQVGEHDKVIPLSDVAFDDLTIILFF